MIRLDTLDALSDSELDQIEAYSQALKKRRDEERKAKAMDEVRTILAAAGIDVKDLASSGKKIRKVSKVRRPRKPAAD